MACVVLKRGEVRSANIAAARALRKASARVLLIDKTNHHVFQPLLYQVATSVLSPENIAAPIRHVLHKQASLVRIHGILAWFVRRTYYLLQMPGWSRRLRIMIDWTFALLFRPDIVKISLESEAAWLLRETEDGVIPLSSRAEVVRE
jgi:NADH dehydrogenase FAD-containing subunit